MLQICSPSNFRLTPGEFGFYGISEAWSFFWDTYTVVAGNGGA